MPPVTHGKLERLQFCLCSKRPRKKKEHFGCGMQFSDKERGAAPPHPPLSTKNCESHFRQLVFTQERNAKVGLCKTAPAKHGSTFL